MIVLSVLRSAGEWYVHRQFAVLSFGNLSVSSFYSNFTPGVTRVRALVSVVCVDSAVRWRRNGAGGLGIVVCLRLFDSWFSAVLQFEVLRGPQPYGAAARRFGCRRTRCSAGCVRFVQKERTLFKFASFASVGAVLSSCRSPRGEFCEPPRGGASARTAENWCLSLQAAAAPNIFSLHLSALPPVAYSSLPRSLRIMNSLVPTRCADRSSSRFVILRSRATKNLYADDTDV